jgi:1-acyl-sn-glycerol-3-phosphate acyltransferase
MREMMNATNTILRRGDLVLVYAEQSMWWNYRKPKPLKIGAFKFAAKANVPVVPTFITMRDTDKLDENGYPIQAYTLHILKPIYPNPSLNILENAENMKKENERVWKEVYEKVYGIPLTYTTEK